MRKKLKLGLIVLAVISALLFVGIMTAGAAETTIDTITVTNSGNPGTKIEYDPSTNTMTFTYVGDTSIYYELQPATSAGDYSVQNFIDKYRTEVEHVEMGFFKKITLVDVSGTNDGGELFAGMTSLKSIHFAKDQVLQNGLKGPGLFEGCESLTTIWFGDDVNKIEGCANFTDSWKSDQNYKDRNNFPRGLFKGCASLEKIIYTENPYEFAILSTTFDGCASLKEVTIGSNITTIADDAFINTGVLEVNAPNGSAAASHTLPTLLERIEAYKVNNDPVNEDYCKSAKTVDGVLTTFTTDIKWEIYNVGTENCPKYTIYFWQDTSSGNTPHDAKTPTITSLSTVLYADATTAQQKYINPSNSFVDGGYASDYGSGIYHVWHSEAIPATSISAIVVGDGIVKLGYNRGTFSGMTGVEVIELPSTMTQMQGAQLKGCKSLETLYTRGKNTPVIGTVNLSNFSSIPMGMSNDNPYYGFAGLKSVKQYVFKSSLKITAAPSPCTFYDNESLTSIVLPEGLTATGVDMFTNCKSLESVTFPSTVTSVVANSFRNCTSLEEVIFKSGSAAIAVDSTATAATGRSGATADLEANAFRNCTALTTLTAPFGSDVWNFAYDHAFCSTHMYVSSVNRFGRYVIDPDTHHFSITDTGYSPSTTWRQYDEDEAELLAFLEPYRNSVLTASVAKFGKVVTQAGAKSVFEDMINLTEVQFAANQRFASSGTLDNKTENQHGLFKGCTSLKTVWLGDASFKKENVIDLSYINIDAPDQDNSANILYYMFSGCLSIEKVILPELTSYYKSEILREPRIWSSTFAGCTSLKTVNIPAGIGKIDNGAFKDCTALETLDYYAPVSVIGTSTFTGTNNGLIIKCQSYEVANSLNSLLTSGGITASSVRAFYKNGISIDGYQVRTSGYNGLRTIFSFYENAFDGYELVECGTLTSTKDTWEKYSESYGDEDSVLVLLNGEFKPADSKIIKTPIRQGGKYVNNYLETETGVSFVVTVKNFADQKQYKTEVVNCGYEIWQKDGNYYVYFTRESKEDYKTTSLYKITLGMLGSRVLTLEKGENPLWNVLTECEHMTFAANDGIVGYYFADPLDSSKKIAIYMTDSTESIELTDIGFDISEKPNVSAMIFGKNVEFDLPLIDDYWQEHIDAQLATLPKGRSFIAITDTHYQSGGLGNIGKSTDLMQYVRSIAGIDKVIHLGDPHHSEDTYEVALEQLSRSMEEKFFDYFGEDGLYAIGNHDSNLTSSRGAVDDDSNTYYMDILLSDTDIYNTTFRHIENGGKINRNVVFDEALLKIIEENKSDIGAFVLDDVSAEEAALYNNMFGDVSYTAEEMYENLVCWAKMHYAYYDHDNAICYIVLNTGALTVTDFALLGRELWKFNPCQYLFLEKILNDVSENYSYYDVVVAGHMLYDSSEANQSYNKDLFSMLSAFEGGTSVSFKVSGNNPLSGKLFGCTDGATSKNLSFDFTGRDFTGEVICVTGHRHLDLDIVSQTNESGTYDMSVSYESVADSLSDNAVLCLLLNQDNYSEENGIAEMNTQKGIKGTITEQSFTIFTITDDKNVVATRIGANSGWMQKTYKLG